MKVALNYKKIENIFKKNSGFITRSEVKDANISTWFLSNFVKKNNLTRIAPGVYANEDYFFDDYFSLQTRYPKYIFSGINALYLHHMTDKIPTKFEVTAPRGYNPSRNKIDSLSVRYISDKNIYNLGICDVETMFGTIVKAYDEERAICDLIKYRDKYDSETFIKAIKYYAKTINNQTKLLNYAKKLKIEEKVYEIMELLTNND